MCLFSRACQTFFSPGDTGTHLASWLQEVSALSVDEGQALLDGRAPATAEPRGARAVAGLEAAHDRRLGHATPRTDSAFSGDVLATKDPKSLRLWRARGDHALLRVVACPGRHVAFHDCGQFLVTGTRGAAGKGLRVWGAGGGSAFTAGRPDRRR